MSDIADHTASYTVPSGPFKDVTSLPGEIFTKADDYTGREYSTWDTHARTRHFLTLFSPLEGWRVEVTQSAIPGVQLPDFTVEMQDGAVVMNPAWEFTATLFDANDRAVANATVVQIFNCAMSIEIGQTRARSKLYQALGLPSSPSTEDESRHPNPQGGERTKQQVVPVVDVPAATEQPKATAAESLEAKDAPEAEVPESSDAVDTSNEETGGSDGDGDQQDDSKCNATADHEIDHEPDLKQVAVVPATAPATTGSMTPAAQKAQKKANGMIPAGLVRQIEIRAKKAKLEVPELHTLEQAQAFLAQLVNPTSSDDLASGGA